MQIVPTFPPPRLSSAGSLCDIKLDPCSSGPCQNGGRCRAVSGGGGGDADHYECRCPDGFEGPNCEVNDEGWSNCRGNHPYMKSAIFLGFRTESLSPSREFSVLVVFQIGQLLNPRQWSLGNVPGDVNPSIKSMPALEVYTFFSATLTSAHSPSADARTEESAVTRSAHSDATASTDSKVI